MLELKNIALELETEEGPVSILKDINLELESNRFYVITGPNGGGKSSLAKLIMGIYQPTRGQIIFDGTDITSMSIAERAKLGLGYAFQQPPRFKGITVNELLKLAQGENQKGAGCGRMYDVGLCPKDYVNREVNGNLSGGELKRIEIATLLVRDLKLGLFDEPEAGIDLWSFAKLTETFRKMHDDQEMTTVIISHQERILELADEIILISDGLVEKQGQKEEMLSDIINACDCRRICLEREDRN